MLFFNFKSLFQFLVMMMMMLVLSSNGFFCSWMMILLLSNLNGLFHSSCHDNVGVEFEWFASLSLVMMVVLNFNGLFHFLLMIRSLNFEMVCLTLL